jgi:septum site-determining protein MinC
MRTRLGDAVHGIAIGHSRLNRLKEAEFPRSVRRKGSIRIHEGRATVPRASAASEPDDSPKIAASHVTSRIAATRCRKRAVHSQSNAINRSLTINNHLGSCWEHTSKNQQNAPVTIATRPPRHSFRFRGRNFLALVLKPEQPLTAWFAELDEWLGRSPGFFTGKPLILDLAGLGFARADIAALIEELRGRAIRILGIEGADPATLDDALPPLLTGGRTSGSVEAIEAVDAIARRAKAAKQTAKRGAEPAKDSAEPIKDSAEPAKDSAEPAKDPAEAAKSAPASAPPARVLSLLVETPVRSGQTIMNPDGDVIILGAVASGAEVIAAGSIHVYGTLRGRALAGIYGAEGARIFCRRFEAELIAIGDHHKVTEDIDASLRQKPVQAWLSHNELKVASLDQTDKDKEAMKWRKS